MRLRVVAPPPLIAGVGQKKMKQQLDPSPENAPAFAASIVETARRVSGVDLDYSEESLARLETIIDSFRNDGVKTDAIVDTLFCMGCYVGEVFVRQGSGMWKRTEETRMKGFASAPMVIQTGPESCCNPIDKVFKRMENGEEDSLPYFYSGFAKPRQPQRPWWRFW